MRLDRFLPALSLRRPVTMLMLFIALIALGLIALGRIPYEMMPKGFNSPYFGFWVPYENSTPTEVEQYIARPFEEQLRTVHGLKYIETNCQNHGCWIWLEMRNGTDMDEAWSQIRDRIDRSMAESELDINRVILRRMSMSNEDVYWMGLSSTLPMQLARARVEDDLMKRLERLDGVAKVDLWGGDDQMVLVDFDLDALGRHHLNLWQISQQLMQSNFAMSCGPVQDGTKRLALRVDANWTTLDQIRELPIHVGEKVLRLEDLADLRIGAPERSWETRIDGEPALLISVSRESEANTEELCKEVDAVLASLDEDPRYESFVVQSLFNQGRFIRESIDNLQESATWGGLFALLILFFFLRRISTTLVITAAIPFCVFISVTTIYFLGWSLNVITMMGLMISVGMVVDNSIVVMESIAIMPENMPRERASLLGSAEVSLAVTVATLTSVVVFLPLMLMGGDSPMSFFLIRIGVPVIVALVASLLVALLFIPQLASRFRMGIQEREPRLVRRGRLLTQRTLTWCLRRRRDAGLLALLCLMSMSIPMQNVKKDTDGEGNVGDFRVILDMPSSYTFTQAHELLIRVEAIVREQEVPYNIRTITSRHSNSWGQLHVWLNEDARETWYQFAFRRTLEVVHLKGDLVMDRDACVEDLKKRLPKVAGVEMRMSWNDKSSEKELSVLLSSPDTEALLGLSREIQRRLNALDDVLDSEIDIEKGEEELTFLLDKEEMMRHGIAANRVAGTLRAALTGQEVGTLKQGDEEIPVRLRLRPEDRDQLHELQDLGVESEGGLLPLRQISRVEHRKNLSTIRRIQGRTFMRIKIHEKRGSKESLQKEVRTLLEGLALPTGVSWSFGRGFDRLEEQEQEQNNALWLAIAFVFLLMGMLFESFSLPFTVLASIPFSFFGAWWTLYLTGTPFDMMAGIGLIILVGVVVNNAIVLVDLTQRLRLEGKPRNEALLEAVGRRFRPVVMTAATTIGGLVPMAVGNAALIGMPYAPMGRAMAGGLLTSTVFTLLVVPLLYVWIDDGRSFVLTLWKRIRGRVPLPDSKPIS
jgi:hydrophobic/amphiphilic exporter-1 (mainly G- bacteria), HAE1 family